MANPRPGLGVSLAITDVRDKLEQQRMLETRRPDTDLPTDVVVAQLLAESGNYTAMLVLGSTSRFILSARERLKIPAPWTGRSKQWIDAAGKVTNRRWAMWQEATPPPITHEDLEALIKAEMENKRTMGPPAEELTIFGVVAAIRKFHMDHGRWPTRGEVAAALGREENVVIPKLERLKHMGYVEKTGQTFVPTETAPSPGVVTVTTWSPEQIKARMAEMAAEKGPSGSPWRNRPAATAAPPAPEQPAVTTPQEVQEDMKGNRNPNRPADADLIAMIQSRIRQKMTSKAAITAVAQDLNLPFTSAHTWYYAALKQRAAEEAAGTQAPAAAQPADDDELFADDAVASPAEQPGAAAQVPEQALGGDGSTEHTDASAGLTAVQDGMLMDVPQADIKMAISKLDPSAAATVATPSGLGQVAPADDELALGPDFVPIDELPRLMTWWDQLAPEKQRDAHERLLIQSQKAHRLLVDRDAQIDRFDAAIAYRDIEIESLHSRARGRESVLEIANADRVRLTEQIIQLENALQGADMANANIGKLMAENAELQDGLKVALETIEQAASAQPGSVSYLVFDNEPGSSPDVLPMTQDDVLSPRDEWARLIMLEGRRRYDMWHCTETLVLPGGNIVCILRPGAAETARQEAA